VVVVVVVVVLLVVLLGRSAPAPAAGNGEQPAPSSLVATVTGVSPQVLAAVGAGGITDPLLPTQGTPSALTTAGKPDVLFISSDYCPPCAAERWSLVVALSRFGTLSGLNISTSSSADIDPNTDTISFFRATYSSPYLGFTNVDTGTREDQVLQTPTAQQHTLLSEYDAPPYVPAESAGTIPFLDLGNSYVAHGVPTGYDPQILQGMTWQQIAQSLSDAQGPQAQAIIGNANWLTAGICKLTGNQPGSVCGAAPIATLEGQLDSS
jgi:hypothetical protein